MKNSLRVRALPNVLVLALAFTAVYAAKAQGQPTAKPPEKQVTAKTMPLLSTPKNVLSFQSTFDQYKPYREEKTASWKGANDEVGRIGGWRAYLKEANETESVQAPVQLPVQTPDAKPANPHAGHGGK